MQAGTTGNTERENQVASSAGMSTHYVYSLDPSKIRWKILQKIVNKVKIV